MGLGGAKTQRTGRHGNGPATGEIVVEMAFAITCIETHALDTKRRTT